MTTPSWHLVIKDMLDRNEFGAMKYNKYLHKHTDENMLQHAYEEALDLAVYLKTLIEQNKSLLHKHKLDPQASQPLSQDTYYNYET